MASPLMEQYHDIKKDHRGEILLFRLGDFYEMFYEDAEAASKTLGIVLTSRAKGEQRIPMCGFPHHSSQGYINRLLKAGHRVAVCEQLQDPEEADGVVERAVVRVITPGTLVEETILEDKRPNWLAAAAFGKEKTGLAWVDTSTGRFLVRELEPARLESEIARLRPAETLVAETALARRPELAGRLKSASGGIVTEWRDWHFDASAGRDALKEQLGVSTLRGFGVEGLETALAAAGALLAYLRETQKGPLRHLNRVERYDDGDRLLLDPSTVAALELLETTRGERTGALLESIDRTSTGPGGRLLAEWITSPLSDAPAIVRRLDAVAELASESGRAAEAAAALSKTCDLERVLARVGAGRATPRDLAALRSTLGLLPGIRSLLKDARAERLKAAASGIAEHPEVRDLLSRALVDEPPPLITEGGIIRAGYDGELDRTRSIASDGKGFLADLERREIKRSGIPSLKVGFNRVFGFYIEITHVHRERIPADYIRKQTLKNAERYITPELKEHETAVLNADGHAKELERRLFAGVRERVAAALPELQATARALAELDALTSLAAVARERGWVRPEIVEEPVLDIRDGRHPVLDRLLAGRFVPNDTALGADGRILLITGPNMAGKSTYLRQTALIALLSHAGSFVPAASARIGRVDRLFARVGASDDLTRHASTFMVEMTETANILHHATEHSLVVLDEIGRGTSTFDGVSIAWAVVEHLHDRSRARTLFATHYHELTDLGRTLKGVRNLHVAVREWGDQVLFLHKILEGPTDRSYGIHVARLAGLPREVIERSRAILAGLEALTLTEGDRPRMGARRPKKGELLQQSLFAGAPGASPVEEALRQLDVERMTPVQALAKLADLVEEAKRKKA